MTTHVDAGGDHTLLAELIREFDLRLGKLERLGGLRRGHEQRRETLRASVRGRVDVTRWVTNLTRGRPELVPCTFSDLRLDNLANRTLRWAWELLRHAGSSDIRAWDELSALDTRARSIELPRVAIAPVLADELPSLQFLPPSFDHYRISKALDLASFVIRNARTRPGQSLELQAFSVTEVIHNLFEDAFQSFVAKRVGMQTSDIGQVEWDLRVVRELVPGTEPQPRDPSNKAKLFRLDLFLPLAKATRPIIVDLKWKMALDSGSDDSEEEPDLRSIDLEGVRVANADLFQLVAYMQAYRARTGGKVDELPVGFLVFPVGRESTTRSFRLEILRPVGGEWVGLDVWLLPWNVSRPREGVAGAWREIERIAGLDPYVESVTRTTSRAATAGVALHSPDQ